MKAIARIITGTVFFVSFLCMLAFGGHTAGQQMLWSLSWMLVCGISGHYWYKLRNTR